MFEKILSFYTKNFAVWVIVFGILAYLFPAPFRVLGPGMEWFFALTMFGIGVVLKTEDFRQIAAKPTLVLIGTCAQFTIMPFGAYAVAKLFNLPQALAVGLILTGAAPDAMSGSVICYIARADVAYAVSLTTVSTLLCPILTPGLTFILARSRLEVPFWNMVLQVILTVIVPLFTGFGVRYYFREKIEKVLAIFPALSVTFIIFICSLVIAMNKARLGQITGLVLAASLTLNIFGMVGGYVVGMAFRMNLARRRTLAIDVGMQNAGLGMVLAILHFGQEAAMPAAAFVFISIITASIMAEIWRRRPNGLVAE